MAQNEGENEDKPWHRIRPLLDRKLQDLIAMYLPNILVTIGLPVLACYVYMPGPKFLLYSVLPSSQQNWLTFTVFIVEEVRYLFQLLGLSCSVYQHQVIAYELITQELEQVVETVLKR